MAYRLYVDESGQPQDDLFLIAGVAIEDAALAECEAKWRAVRRAHPQKGEAHWHELVGQGATDRHAGEKLLDDLFALMAALPLTCFAVVIATRAARRERPDLFGQPGTPSEYEL